MKIVDLLKKENIITMAGIVLLKKPLTDQTK